MVEVATKTNQQCAVNSSSTVQVINNASSRSSSICYRSSIHHSSDFLPGKDV